MRFIVTFAVHNSIGMSAAFFYQTGLVTKQMCTKEEYQYCWNQIGRCLLPQDQHKNQTPTGHVYFWKHLENAVNETYRQHQIKMNQKDQH